MRRATIRTNALGLTLGIVILGGATGAQSAAPSRDDLRAKAEASTRPFLPIIEEHAGDHGVDPALVMAVITVESKGNPSAYSRSGAMGLMQLMPAACEDFGVSDPYEPDENIRGGTAMIARHLSRYRGDLQRVLAAYNAGPRRADDGSWKRIRETRRYVPSVLAYYRALRPDGDGYHRAGEPLSVAPAVPAGVALTDAMFDVVRTRQAQTETEAIAENGALHDVAGTLLSENMAGKVTAKGAQDRLQALLARMPYPPKSATAFIFRTPDLGGFPAAWAKQPATPGRFVGVAHGTKGGQHVWVVVLADN